MRVAIFPPISGYFERNGLTRTHCVIRRLALTVSDVCLKLGCFHSTSTYSLSHVKCYINSAQLTHVLTF